MASRSGRVHYAGGAVGFRLPRHTEPGSVAIRLDAGPAARWRDLTPELARLDLPVARTALTRPADGPIWVPAHLLLTATLLEVSFGRRSAVTRFRVGGLGEAIAIAKSRGCVVSEQFVL